MFGSGITKKYMVSHETVDEDLAVKNMLKNIFWQRFYISRNMFTITFNVESNMQSKHTHF